MFAPVFHFTTEYFYEKCEAVKILIFNNFIKIRRILDDSSISVLHKRKHAKKILRIFQ